MRSSSLLVLLVVLLVVACVSLTTVVHAHAGHGRARAQATTPSIRIVSDQETTTTTTLADELAALAHPDEARADALRAVAARAALAHAAATASPDPTPTQQRIALVPGGMTVSWTTVGPLDTTPAVQYGLSPAALGMKATGISETYAAASTSFHHVVLRNLAPRTDYYWQVITPYNASSPILRFNTGLPAGDLTPFSVSINGDMGITNSADSIAMLKQQAKTLDLFWHIGDLAYADDYFAYKTNITYEQIYEEWMTEMTDVWNERPYMFTPGNHEASCNGIDWKICPPSQANFTAYLQRFRMPFAESGGPNNMYYSFDYGMVHFISMDTEVAFPNSPEGPDSGEPSGPFGDQVSWMEADLRKAVANRANVPWIFVGGHRPYYSCDAGSVLDSYRAAFEAMFIQYGVDVVFWGHVHWYERLWPTGANGTVEQHDYNNPSMPVYVITSSPGNVEGLNPGSITQPYTAVLDNTHYGLATLTVHNTTHVSMVFQESKTGIVYDEWTLYKAHAPQALA